METKHTPGPWKIHTSFEKREIHPANDPDGLFIIADVLPEEPDLRLRDANAKLIAAAPELLSALKAILMWHKGYGTKTQSEIMREYVEPAIDKATK